MDGSRARHARSETAFTMVEIAIALAVIGFALVAIIGVLPSGLEVQKDNREETIINQDAAYFMDAIRSGALGLNDLTNYVVAITNRWTAYNTNVPLGAAWQFVDSGYDGYDRYGSVVSSLQPAPAFRLTNGFRIIGLLGTPKYVWADTAYGYVHSDHVYSNHIVAYVRSLSGPASERSPQRDTNVQSLAFSYRFISEVVPVALPTPDLSAPFTNTPYARNLRANLNEVRLLFRWPLFPNGNTGNGRQVYRSQVAGLLLRTNVPRNIDLSAARQPLYFFQPTTFVNVTSP
jgi:type II secretory pathway pseudopilin PulG